MTKKLYDYDVGENVSLFVLIKTSETRIAKNGNKFIAINFSDKSGVISAKFWDASAKDIEHFKAGNVVYLKGKRENYQNNPQIKIAHLRLAKEDEPRDPSLYVPDAPEETRKMKEELEEYLEKIENKTWHDVVKLLFQENSEQFLAFPAAKSNHHAYSGGLAYHTLSILRMAEAVSGEYPEVNKSLLYAGAILHDMGKTLELSGPVATTYTLEGNLLGHIVLIDEQIVLAMKKLDVDLNSEDAVLLRHMIVSHHGLLEYGSPVKPLLLEADVLHQLDNLDASIQMIRNSVSRTEGGAFTERLFAMDGRMFYHPKVKEKND